MIDPVDATTVPREIRREALSAAMLGLQAYLAMKEIHLDALARLELLDVALGDLAAEYDPVADGAKPSEVVSAGARSGGASGTGTLG